jgi:hypothetical protein
MPMTGMRVTISASLQKENSRPPSIVNYLATDRRETNLGLDPACTRQTEDGAQDSWLPVRSCSTTGHGANGAEGECGVANVTR